MSNINILMDLCTGCKKCLKICDRGAITIVDKKAVIDLYKCDLCGLCVNSCKYEAIVIQKILKKDNLDKFKGVWVFVEYLNNGISEAFLQVLSRGYELAQKLKERLTAVLVVKDFNDNENIKKILSEYGVSNIKLLKSTHLNNQYVEDVARILAEEVLIDNPSIFLFLGTHFGRELAPRISTKINTGLTADCTDLKIDSDNNLVQIRPTYGGKILASIICPDSRPQMASIRPNIFVSKKVTAKNISVECKDIDIKDSITKVKKIVKCIKIHSSLSSIDEAEIIVCGGLGVGSKENFKLLEQLAQKLNGAVAGSREAVDRGWIDFSHQIGQTGKIVRPRIYIGCGVSGAIHHLIGMKKSKTIIAINTDKKAPILKIADVAIVGDLFNVIPLLIGSI